MLVRTFGSSAIIQSGNGVAPVLISWAAQPWFCVCFPLWLAMLVSGMPFVVGLVTGELRLDQTAFEHWEARVLLGAFVSLLIHELLLWRGRLGVVNREVMRTTSTNKLVAMLGVRRLTFRWSVALWHGLLLGVVDALLGRNGHRR